MMSTLPAEAFDQLEAALRTQGPEAAVDQLCAELRQRRDYTSLFYALLMKKRHQLGVLPLPTSPALELPPDVQLAYEDGIRAAAREVGHLFLEAGDVAQAWLYFRMIEEPAPVREALDRHDPDGEGDLHALVQVAFYEGVHVRKGFDWVLGRFGICNAITTLSSAGELPHSEADRHYCVRALVRSLYEELRHRIATDVEGHEGQPPAEGQPSPGTPGVVRQLIADRPYLFAEDAYHIDLSHLSSVVQMSLQLNDGPELGLARELCAYGARLTGGFVSGGDPPFEDLYPAHDRYLAILQGEDVQANLDYFRDQAAKADPEEVGTYPAEVLVNLLLRVNQPHEALVVARKYLAPFGQRRLTCPGVAELCQQLGDYQSLSEVARQQGDPVQFLAGLLAKGKK